jgi:O-antigen/teichoic acid export membrane protein
VSVSQLVGPVLVYLDRVLVGSFMSLGAVADYTVPYEAMTRLRIIPTSLVNTLYPAFSERGADARGGNIQRLYEGSTRYLLLVFLPAISFLVVLGPDVLSVWMGPKFANGTSLVLQILAIGVLLNAIGYVPYNALQALGRPDVPAKFHVLELPLHVLLCILLIPHWGIVGAAIATTVRVSLDALLLFWAAQRYCSCPFSLIRAKTLFHLAGLATLLCLGFVALRFSVTAVWPRLFLSVAVIPVYFLLAWVFVVDINEKPRISNAVRILIKQPAS